MAHFHDADRQSDRRSPSVPFYQKTIGACSMIMIAVGAAFVPEVGIDYGIRLQIVAGLIGAAVGTFMALRA